MKTSLPSSIIPWGFRGDALLLYTVHNVVKQAGIQLFVETGAFYGTTVRHMARSYPPLTCYSCEPNRERYAGALQSTNGLSNCHVTQEESPALLARLAQTDAIAQPTLFWLDAHGYGFDWPLRTEIQLITDYWQTAYIFIDDLHVPGQPWLDYDEYGGQECSIPYIQDVINPARSVEIWYPNYPPQVVTWPLRGWGVVVIDDHQAWSGEPWLKHHAHMTEDADSSDRAAQRRHWHAVIEETRHTAALLSLDEGSRAWERLAQQVPHWMVGDLAQQMLEHGHFHQAPWTVCALRLASDGEIARSMEILAALPGGLANHTLQVFSSALSPTVRADVVQWLQTAPAKKSLVHLQNYIS
jgi:hypothetical protein